MRPKVLVVDDDAGVRYTLRELLEDSQIEVHEAEDGEIALSMFSECSPDLVVTDLAMPNMDGMTLLKKLSATAKPPKVIMITAHGSERHAVEAMKQGAFDYFSKPFDIDVVMKVIERAVASVRLDKENEQLRAELHLARHMVFSSEAMRKVSLLIQRVAPKDVSILLTGPSGTGKELVAEALVAASSRKDKPFIRFNCAAVPLELAEAELFGHAKGAFTGAIKKRSGLFREADSGTLLLDEIGELDIMAQGKLLRVLQEGTVRPIGEDKEISVDVRVIAATNRNLESEIQHNRFREDLFFRINVVEISLPPLSARLDDIPPLTHHFLRKYSDRFGTQQPTLSAEILKKLYTSDYPGNIRELEHRIERLVALSSGGLIDDSTFEMTEQDLSTKSDLSLKQRVEAFERGLIYSELRRNKGNKSQTARKLGIGRVTLLDKLKKYDSS